MMIKQILLKPIKSFLVGQDKYHSLKRLIPPGLKNTLKIFKYNFWLLYTTLTHRVDQRPLDGIKRFLQPSWRILFYPDLPWQNAVIYQICLILGCKITNKVDSPFDLAVKWRNTTIDQLHPALERLADENPVINLNCTDISKTTVESIFEEVFGYSLAVDPRKFVGKCLQKSNLNSRHNGKIIDCPTQEQEMDPDSVYQVLIDNRSDDKHTVDMRVPVFKGYIPFVSFLIRPIEYRFEHFRFTGDNYRIEKASKVFTSLERRKIQLFCEKIGLDYGELDILRNNKDDRIYIVDANNTPDGPPIHVGLEGDDLRHKTLLMRAQNFERVFLNTD